MIDAIEEIVSPGEFKRKRCDQFTRVTRSKANRCYEQEIPAQTSFSSKRKDDDTNEKVKKKKRRCSDLDLLAGNDFTSKRYSKETSRQWYLYSGAVEITEEKIRSRLLWSQKAHAAKAKKKQLQLLAKEKEEKSDNNIFFDASNSVRDEPGMASNRRVSIMYLFQHVLGSPPEASWDGHNGAVSFIMKRLSIPKNSRRSVRKVLQDIVEANTRDEEYDPHRGPRSRRKISEITNNSIEARIILDALSHQFNLHDATMMVNSYRLSQNKDTVSWSSVRDFTERSKCVRICKRGKRKMGSTDPNSKWAIKRKAFVEQLIDQIDKVTNFGYVTDLPSLNVAGIAFWDEFHMKVLFGQCSDFEYFVSQNPETREFRPTDQGGKWPEPQPKITAKFPGEARMCAGVAMKEKVKGEPSQGFVGEALGLKKYTGKDVVGPKTFLEHCAKTVRRWRDMKKPRENVKSALEKQAKLGDEEYSEEVIEEVNKKYMCITDIMEFVIEKSKEFYKGTRFENTFLIYHDGLAAWWSADAQAHMRSLGFEDRQVRFYNEVTETFEPPSGNSPEVCRGLDSHGFAYLKAAIKANATATLSLPDDDERKYKVGTPDDLFKSIERTFKSVPTSDQIVTDILGLRDVLVKIDAHSGCVVPDENFRHGYRDVPTWRNISNGKPLKHKTRPRQRKADLTDLNSNLCAEGKEIKESE